MSLMRLASRQARLVVLSVSLLGCGARERLGDESDADSAWTAENDAGPCLGWSACAAESTDFCGTAYPGTISVTCDNLLEVPIDCVPAGVSGGAAYCCRPRGDAGFDVIEGTPGDANPDVLKEVDDGCVAAPPMDWVCARTGLGSHGVYCRDDPDFPRHHYPQTIFGPTGCLTLVYGEYFYGCAR